VSHATAEFGIAALSANDLIGVVSDWTSAVSRQRRSDRRSWRESNLATTAPEPLAHFYLVFAEGDSLALEIPGDGDRDRLLDLISDLQRLAALRRGWDSYGAQPLRASTVARTVTHLHSILLREDIPAPTLVPTRSGGLQLEWHRRGIDIEIVVPPSGPIEMLFIDPEEGVELEADSIDEVRIVSALQRVSAVAN
jgi:hypothetical protein